MDTNQPTAEYPQETKAHRGRGRFFLIAIIVVVVFGSFRYGLYLGGKGFIFEPTSFKVINQKDRPYDVDYNLLWDTIDIVNDKFIDKPIDQKKVLYGAIHGAVAAAGDEYTQYYDPEEFKDFQTQLSGSFQGIGAEIDRKNSEIVIISPIEGSPAERAGLRPNDIIVAVNGESTADWSAEKTAKTIRGPSGTEVKLMIYRDSESRNFEVTIKREVIKSVSVKLETKDQNGKKIAVITVSRFGDDTQVLFKKAVSDAKAQNVAGVILDLRNDPGGYLDTAIDMSSYWLPKDDLVVTEAHSDGVKDEYKSQGFGQFQGIKTIVLINQGSASASEIVAGALRDHNVATLLGEKSFGKGSVQELIDLPDGSAVKVTVAKWITPNGRNLNKDGLVPDIEVKFSDDDIKNQNDSQMNRALEEVAK